MDKKLGRLEGLEKLEKTLTESKRVVGGGGERPGGSHPPEIRGKKVGAF